MWLDDDGDDDPIAGPVPDPSQRHWRHPSEVGKEFGPQTPNPVPTGASPEQEAAATPDLVLAGGGGHAEPSRRRRPGPVVGSCVAVAALGLATLFVAGPATDEEVVAGGSGSVDADEAGGEQSNRSGQPVPTTASVEIAAGTTARLDASPTSAGEGRADGADVELRSEAITTVATDTAASSTTMLGDDDDADRATETETVAGDPPEDGPHPGVFRRADPGARLGSFVVTDDLVLTSAGAVDDAGELSLWLGDRWVDAVTLIIDPQTDIAVLRALDTTIASDLAPMPAVGQDVWTAAVQGASEPPAGTPKRPAPNPEPRDEVSAFSAAVDAGAPVAAADKGRLGVLIDIAPTTIRSGHDLYGTLRTDIPASAEVIGGPLLDKDGRAIGLIVEAEGPNVAAIPIEATVAYARSLVATGTPSTEWPGFGAADIDGRPGVLVTADQSEAIQSGKLLAGDIVVAFDDRPVRDLDHFYHLVRVAGPGSEITLSVRRDDELVTVTCAISSPDVS